MRIIVLNLGSTSFKFKLYDMEDQERLLASGSVESIGGAGAFKVKAPIGTAEGSCTCATHIDAFNLCIEELNKIGIEIDIENVDAVGYKAVHGGRLSDAHVVNDELLLEMEKMTAFAPAHNPVYLNMMREVAQNYPNLRQIACFETAFHASVPEERAVYGVPNEWVEKYGIRRYGFHGSSHSYIAYKMKELAPEARRVISLHLGGSSSMCAILDGKSIATTMGATPQSGLFHNNRVGDFDVFCLPELCEQEGGIDAVMKKLASHSGFLGLSGVSADLREVEKAKNAGNAKADLAIRAFTDNIVGYIGMFAAYLGGLDAIVFTGGIGQNSFTLRQAVCERLQWLGVKLDPNKNCTKEDIQINTADSSVGIYAMETNEELMVARGAVRVIKGM